MPPPSLNVEALRLELLCALNEHPGIPVDSSKLPDYDAAVVNDEIVRAQDAGLIKAKVLRSGPNVAAAVALRLTPAGAHWLHKHAPAHREAEKPASNPQTAPQSQVVASRDQRGGITAHTVHLTMPQPPKRHWWKSAWATALGFAALAAAAVSVLGYFGVRPSGTQAGASEPSYLKITRSWPVPSLVPEFSGRVAMNTAFVVDGKRPVSRVTAVSRLAYLSGPQGSTDAAVKQLFDEARAEATRDRVETALAPGVERFMTTPDQIVLGHEDTAKILADKAALVALGVVLYEDAGKTEHETDFCLFYDGSLTAQQGCRVYNKVR